MMPVVMITALTRNSSEAITSRISACSKSAETLERAPPMPCQKSVIAVMCSPVIPGRLAEANPESRDSGFGAAHRPGMTESDTASIQRAAEARDGDRHGEQRQAEQRQRVIFQVLQGRALQHDRAHDPQVMRQ